METGYNLTRFNQDFNAMICAVDCGPREQADQLPIRFGHVSLDVVDVFHYSGSSPERLCRSQRHIGSSQADDYVFSLPLTSEIQVSQFERRTAVPVDCFSILNTACPFASVCVDPDPDFGIVIVKVPGRYLRPFVPDLDQCCAVPVATQRGAAAILKALLNAICAHSDDLSETQASEYGLMLVRAMGIAICDAPELKVERLTGGQRAQVRLRRKAEAFIDSSLGNPLLDVPMVADHCGVSLRGLYKAYEYSSMSVAATIRERRMQACRRALRSEALRGHSIDRIAINFGFTSLGSFSRAYRQHYGLSPREERSRSRVLIVDHRSPRR